jgi:light-independent protochlorophyllide reductase B subunit
MNVSTSACSKGLNYGLPCSFTGALIGLAGIDGVDILVNGPSACTGLAAAVIEGCRPLMTRNSAMFSRLAAQGHPRIPCSEITDTDVILGIGDKLIQAVEKLASKRDCECIAIVNSCSLSLIGEDAANILKDHSLSDSILYLESTGCTGALSKGFSDALIQLIKKVADERAVTEDATVNILGLPINQYSWKHDAREIQRLMTLAGLKVNATLAAGSNLGQIRQLPNASLNVVINSDYGLEIARFMEERFKLPYVTADRMPIGFDATRKLIDNVLDFFGTPPSLALDEEEQRCRKEAVLALSHSQKTDLIRGLPVAIFGERAFVSGLSLFLKDYLGCYPSILGVQGQHELSAEEVDSLCSGVKEEIKILMNADQDEVQSALKESRPVIVFGSAFEDYLLAQLEYSPKFFIETTSPVLDRVNLVHRPYLGFVGALTFVEAILNCKLTNRYPYS